MSRGAGSTPVLGVVGAGTMGSGIAQKMAMEGFSVVLVDVNQGALDRGLNAIAHSLEAAVTKGILDKPTATIAGERIRATTRLNELSHTDLVVEAIFEDLAAKRDLFGRMDAICEPRTILATNTSSFRVGQLAAATTVPERVIGLHYFFHPAKNRLVEVVPSEDTSVGVFRRAWQLQERIGKTPIRSADTYGFVVNRFFVPWLNEATRLMAQGLGSPSTIDAVARETFGIGMGPFELMNVTGVQIARHAADTLGQAFGPMYAPSAELIRQAETSAVWDLSAAPDETPSPAIAERLLSVVFHVASTLVEDNVATVDDTDIGARVGLKWRRGPFELMNHYGIERAHRLVSTYAHAWHLSISEQLERHHRANRAFSFLLVNSDVRDGIATLTINRPDALNALNETVVEQLRSAFDEAEGRRDVRGIVIAGSGKAFLAGADVRFFVKNIEAGSLDRILQFSTAARDLLYRFQTSVKPVIARVHGLTLGGGLELALACHRIIATPRATFAFPETGIGIYPGLGGTQRTTRRVGTALAKWLVLTGQTLAATEAEAIGLIDQVVPHEQLDREVAAAIDAGIVGAPAARSVPTAYQHVAEFFAQYEADGPVPDAFKSLRHKAPIALRIANDLIDKGAGLPLDDALRLEASHVERVFQTRDAYEGLASIGRKRPVFEGK